MHTPWGFAEEEKKHKGGEVEKGWEVIGMRANQLNQLSLLKEKSKAGALELTTLLLFLPSPSSVQLHTKALLACLYTSRTAYHNHKVLHWQSQMLTITASFGAFPQH